MHDNDGNEDNVSIQILKNFVVFPGFATLTPVPWNP